MKKHFTAHFIFAATAMASQQALAIGFGRVVSDAVLGQTLYVTVPVQVEPGQRFGADCVSAEVYFGDSPLPPSAVRAQVDPGSSNTDWLVRISTTTPISEPVVDVRLSAGCEQRFQRRFTLFADPPDAADTRVTPPAVKALPAVSSQVRLGAVAPAGGNAPAAPGPGTVRSREGRPKGPSLALADELNAKRSHRAADNGVSRKSARAPAPVDTPHLVLDGGYARLKLDMSEPIIPAAASASGAEIGLGDPDDPATRQLRELEQSVQAMKRADQASHDQTARLQAQLAEAQSRGDWLPWALGLLALALAAVAALAWRLRQQARLAHRAWFNESQISRLPPTPPEPAPVREPQVPTAPQDLPGAEPRVVPEHATVDLHEAHAPAGSDGDAVVAEASATQPLDRATLAGLIAQEAAPRELSVEELLDLEQQADFFIALGQEDAAVDLLMSHLRSAGGQSPLPYTKLLEIYRRQGDRSAYERTRARFNRRFNAYAPDWDTGPTAGRSLEDYPDTIAQIQAVWASPIDAMAVLEGLLFKRDDTSELFDLPAYRDVLVLYSLARDLWHQGGGLTGTPVDVLLPLDDPHGAAYAPPGRADELDLPLDVDAAPMSYEMTDFAPTGVAASLDLEIPSLLETDADDGPHGDGVRATLDALRLAPIGSKRPASSGGREPGKPSPDDVPTKR